MHTLPLRLFCSALIVICDKPSAPFSERIGFHGVTKQGRLWAGQRECLVLELDRNASDSLTIEEGFQHKPIRGQCGHVVC